MATSLEHPTETEQWLAKTLRDQSIAVVKRQGMDAAELAERLGLLPSGAEMLLRRTSWSLAIAMRVAGALGLEVEFAVRSANA